MSRKIVLNGKKSDWYKSATFILKDSHADTLYTTDLECYAEEVVENYLKREGLPSHTGEHYKWIDSFFFVSIGVLILVSSIGILLKF